jgi:hypothetical protein
VLLLLFSTSIQTVTAQEFRERNETFQLSSSGKVSIDTYKGSIKVDTWDKEEVKVYVKIVADESWNGTDPEDQLEEVKIKFKSSDDALYIESDYKNISSWFGSQTRALVNYVITMPKNANLFVDDYKSESEIAGLNADINFETYKGTLKVFDFRGSVNIETYKGEIKIEADELTGDCNFETYKGRIILALPSESAFTIDADIGRKGDLKSDFDINLKEALKRGYDYIKGDVNGGGYKLSFDTYKGDFILNSK